MFGARHGFRVCTWTRYLGGYIGKEECKKRLYERGYTDVGEECQHDKKNCGEISPRELRPIDTCNPIIMDITSMRHLGHSNLVRRSGENDSQKLFSSYFL